MDGREDMALSGSNSYYLNRGFSGSGSVAGSGQQTGLPVPPGYEHLSNPNISAQSNVRVGSVGATFQLENPSPNFPRMAVAMAESPGKKKRGRPRKYRPPEGTNMSLGLSPMSSTLSPGAITPTPKRSRGRPPGSGRKQQLASLGEWMNSSAGLAFTPHVIHITLGEDIAAKILSFAQQRPRALCILSASGAVSTVTLREPTSSSGTITYEGRFEILCLSGSYLLAESGGPRNRSGGLSISICSPDGHIIGGGIGGRLIAASQIQVNVFSFVYGGSKTKNNTEDGTKDDKGDKSSKPSSAGPSQNLTPSSAMVAWPPSSRPDLRNPHTEIDLTRG